MSAIDDAAAADAALVSALGGPQRVTGDAGSVEQFKLADLIAAHKYLASIAASTTRNRGLRFNKLTPDGTAGRRRCGGLTDDRWPYGFGG